MVPEKQGKDEPSRRSERIGIVNLAVNVARLTLALMHFIFGDPPY
jgi:hypothetical protein